MMSADRKNDTISFIRVMAMMSIVIGHICTWNNIPTYQLGAIGVEVFLFISGYLYGNKKIENRKKWLINRGRRILIPFWILSAFISLVMLIKGDVINGIKQVFCAAFNLQGLEYLFPGFDVKLHFVGGIGHCWFVTMIMLCYILTALIKESRIESYIDCRTDLAIGFAIILQIVLAYLGIQISYIIQFFIGYFYRRSENKGEQHKRSTVLYCTVLMIVSVVVRLITNRIIDGTILYDRVIARLSFIALGTWLYLIGVAVCSRYSDLAKKIVNNRIWKWLDKVSYAVFLVHYMFMKEPFDLKGLFANIPVQIAMLFALTLVSGSVLCFFEKCVNEQLRKCVNGE